MPETKGDTHLWDPSDLVSLLQADESAERET
jgi:hypothetical protein